MRSASPARPARPAARLEPSRRLRPVRRSRRMRADLAGRRTVDGVYVSWRRTPDGATSRPRGRGTRFRALPGAGGWPRPTACIPIPAAGPRSTRSVSVASRGATAMIWPSGDPARPRAACSPAPRRSSSMPYRRESMWPTVGRKPSISVSSSSTGSMYAPFSFTARATALRPPGAATSCPCSGPSEDHGVAGPLAEELSKNSTMSSPHSSARCSLSWK